jgi:hypothetical protein
MQEQKQKKSQRETKRRRKKHEGHELWRHEEKEEW